MKWWAAKSAEVKIALLLAFGFIVPTMLLNTEAGVLAPIIWLSVFAAIGHFIAKIRSAAEERGAQRQRDLDREPQAPVS